MDLIEWYDATIADRDQDAVARLVVIPGYSVSDPEILADAAGLMARLDLQPAQELSSPSFLPHAFLAVLREETTAPAAELLRTLVANPQAFSDIPPEVRMFAEQLAFARLVAFEASPLELSSVATILTSGSGVAIGAYAGVVASGGTPLIIVTVPAGMIIGGAAAGIAKALQEGLYDRLLSWLRGRSRQTA